jgi:hypothetical protein
VFVFLAACAAKYEVSTAAAFLLLVGPRTVKSKFPLQRRPS